MSISKTILQSYSFLEAAVFLLLYIYKTLTIYIKLATARARIQVLVRYKLKSFRQRILGAAQFLIFYIFIQSYLSYYSLYIRPLSIYSFDYLISCLIYIKNLTIYSLSDSIYISSNKKIR